MELKEFFVVSFSHYLLCFYGLSNHPRSHSPPLTTNTQSQFSGRIVKTDYKQCLDNGDRQVTELECYSSNVLPGV